MRPAQHLRYLGVVEILQRHRVELDLQPCRLRGVDALHDLVEMAPAGDGVELVGVERVQRDIDALDAAIGELGGKTRQLRTIGGQRQFFQRAALQMPRQLAHQMHDVLAHQRFAAGEAQFAHTLFDEDGAEPVKFLKRQQILLGKERHVLGHAIGTAEIAAVGDRHAQVADRATERIDHVHASSVSNGCEWRRYIQLCDTNQPTIQDSRS